MDKKKIHTAPAPPPPPPPPSSSCPAGKKNKNKNKNKTKAKPKNQPAGLDDEQAFIDTLTNEKILALYKIVGEKTGAPDSKITPEMEKEILSLDKKQRVGAAQSLKVLSSILLFDFYPTLVLLLEAIAEAAQDKETGKLTPEHAQLYDDKTSALLQAHVKALERIKTLSEQQRTLEALMCCIELDELADLPAWLNERYVEPRLRRLDEIAGGIVADLKSQGDSADDSSEAAVGSMLGRSSKV